MEIAVDDMIVELQEAFEQETTDPVSIATLIEWFTDELNKAGTLEETAQFLEFLTDLLEENTDVVFQISWDLPQQLIKYIHGKNIKTYEILRANPIILPIMKCFMTLATHGDPRKLLVAGCELISATSVEVEVEDYKKYGELVAKENHDDVPSFYMNRDPGDFFIGIKVHVLYEMVFNCLKRISTLYPSKYLSVFVAALEKAIVTNTYNMQDPSALIRRAFLLCRDYEPQEPPVEVQLNDGEKIPDDQLDDIIKNEIQLQAKLLRRLITTAAGEGFRDTLDRSLFEYFYKISNLPLAKAEFYNQILPLKNNVYDTALSLDIDLIEEFSNTVERAKKIYKGIPSDSEVTSRDAQILISKNILKLSLTYQLQNLQFKNSLDLDDNGIIVLCSWFYLFNHRPLKTNVTFEDMIYLYLKFVTPQIFSKSFTNISGEGALQFFMWATINQEPCSTIRKSLENMSQIILNSFLNCLLLRICNEKKRKDQLMMESTLLTRILCLSPKELVFNFCLDNLQDFPFASGKLLLLQIFKDLIVTENSSLVKSKSVDDKDNAENNVEDVIKTMDKLTLDQKKSETKSKHYLELSKNQMLLIQELVQDTVSKMEENGNENNNQNENVVLEKTIVAFLNFFIDVKEHWSKPLFKQLKDNIINSKIEFHDKTSIDSLLEKL